MKLDSQENINILKKSCIISRIECNVHQKKALNHNKNELAIIFKNIEKDFELLQNKISNNTQNISYEQLSNEFSENNSIIELLNFLKKYSKYTILRDLRHKANYYYNFLNSEVI